MTKNPILCQFCVLIISNSNVYTNMSRTLYLTLLISFLSNTNAYIFWNINWNRYFYVNLFLVTESKDKIDPIRDPLHTQSSQSMLSIFPHDTSIYPGLFTWILIQSNYGLGNTNIYTTPEISNMTTMTYHFPFGSEKVSWRCQDKFGRQTLTLIVADAFKFLYLDEYVFQRIENRWGSWFFHITFNRKLGLFKSHLLILGLSYVDPSTYFFEHGEQGLMKAPYLVLIVRLEVDSIGIFLNDIYIPCIHCKHAVNLFLRMDFFFIIQS